MVISIARRWRCKMTVNMKSWEANGGVRGSLGQRQANEAVIIRKCNLLTVVACNNLDFYNIEKCALIYVSPSIDIARYSTF